jgi:hypothetical protein
MSESRLILSMDDLRSDFGYRLGYGRESANWDFDQKADVEWTLGIALQWVYWPDAFPEFHWTFMRPTGTLTTVASQWRYTLPDDYGAPRGPFLFSAGTGYTEIPIVNEAMIIQLRATVDTTGVPCKAAVRPLPEQGASGTRFEALLYPTPQQAWPLTYQYDLVPDALTPARPYPLGSPQLSELYRMAGYAAIEVRFERVINGPEMSLFQSKLNASIRREAGSRAPDTLSPTRGFATLDEFYKYSGRKSRYLGVQ